MANLTTIREPVTAPSVTPPPYGLFSVVAPRTTSEGRWQVGVTWDSAACRGLPRTSRNPCITGAGILNFTPEMHACNLVTAEALTVFAYSLDNVLGGDLDQRKASARERLLAGEEAAVGRYLQTLLAAAVPAPVAVGTFVGIERLKAALGYVEEQLRLNYLGQGVIHVDPAAATMLGLTVQNGRLVTPLGTPVAVELRPTADGTAPTGTVIYGTGAVVVYREANPQYINDVMNRDINEYDTIAQRTYVVGWDCTAVGAAVTYA